jgi:HEAT repeat protein
MESVMEAEVTAIERCLERLAEGTKPLRSDVLVLSGLSHDEGLSLREVWPSLTSERRRIVVTLAGEIAEEDIMADFSALFKVAIHDSDANVRVLAIQGLWEYAGRDLIKPLVRLVSEDPDPGVRATAALALGNYVVRGECEELPKPDLEAVEEALQRAYVDDREIDVRARCLEALGARSQPYVDEMIQSAHASPNYRMRLSAIHAMGRNGNLRWMPVLLQEMGDEEAEVRFEAVSAVGQVADDNAIGAIAELLDDDDLEVQLAAIDALGHIGGRRAKQRLRPMLKHGDEWVREAARVAIEEADFDEDPLTQEYRV